MTGSSFLCSDRFMSLARVEGTGRGAPLAVTSYSLFGFRLYKQVLGIIGTCQVLERQTVSQIGDCQVF